jgi:hypothetical protein
MSAVAYLGALHALLALLCLHVSLLPRGDAMLALTLRHQFNGWGELIALYRNTSSYAPPLPNGTRAPIPLADALWHGETMRDALLGAAWCAEYLPPGVPRAPFCACASRRHDLYLNASSPFVAAAQPIPTAVRNDAVVGLVSCLNTRPVWRVWRVWATHLASPCVYVLVVAAAFCWVASDLGDVAVRRLVWALCGYTALLLLFAGPARHILWCGSVLLVAVLVHWVVLPGLAPADGDDQERLLNAPGDYAQMPRAPSCFWWAEYLCAPVFALYAGALHGGRDLVYVCVVVTLGAAVGGLGMRSFWCGHAYPDGGAKGQLRPVLQRVVWLGILAASGALVALAAAYYQPGLPVRLGDGSVVLLGATVTVSLLQYPGTEAWSALPVQCGLALARNLALFLMVLLDAGRVG